MSEELKSICPLCDKEFTGPKHKSALRLHVLQAHTKDKKEEKPQQDPGTCDHDFIALKGATEVERRAMRAGYKEVCVKCKDLR